MSNLLYTTPRRKTTKNNSIIVELDPDDYVVDVVKITVRVLKRHPYYLTFKYEPIMKMESIIYCFASFRKNAIAAIAEYLKITDLNIVKENMILIY